MTLMIRPAAVAGRFYPDRPEELRTCIDTLLKNAHLTMTRTGDAPPKAVIVPHAGYMYSGPIAARLYARLAPFARQYRRVILLGPAHRALTHGLALPACDAFATPLGNVEIDRMAREAILDLPQVGVSDAVHAQEHSLEVQLPFLQTILPNFTILPLAVGNVTPDKISAGLERLWGGPETLIAISSDLSHYHPYALAQETDSRTAEHILALEPLDDPRSACGAGPINGLLQAARRHKLHPELIDLRNSGDTEGDRQCVVGYAAISFTATEPEHAH